VQAPKKVAAKFPIDTIAELLLLDAYWHNLSRGSVTCALCQLA